MVVSILSRKTSLRSEEEWRQRLERARPRLLAHLQKQPGFVSVEFLWSDGGKMGEMTTWRSLEDCHRYIREGAAALAATIADAALPTAPYPDGTWLRQNYEVVEG